MTSDLELHLYEEALLLALRDEEGTTEMGAWYQQAVGGALLAELLLRGRLRLGKHGRREVVEVVDRRPLGSELLDEWLRRIADDPRLRTLQDWTSRVANTKDLKHRAALGLCRRGVLRADEDKVLLIFTRRIYPEIDPRPEQRIVERLRHAVLTDTDEVEPRTVVLLSLAKHTGLLRTFLDKKELKERKQRLTALVTGDAVGKAAQAVVQATQAAIVAVCVVPVVIT